jgi:hypothetical protein
MNDCMGQLTWSPTWAPTAQQADTAARAEAERQAARRATFEAIAANVVKPLANLSTVIIGAVSGRRQQERYLAWQAEQEATAQTATVMPGIPNWAIIALPVAGFAALLIGRKRR